MRSQLISPLLAVVSFVAWASITQTEERFGRDQAIAGLGDDEPGAQDFTSVPEPVEIRQPFRVTGREQLAWDQPAASYDELRELGFLAHVEGGDTVRLSGVECSSTSGSDGFGCTARLPLLPHGTHVLRVSAYVDSGGREPGAASAPLLLEFGREGDVGSVASGRRRFVTADHVELYATTIASGLEAPTALAALPDGRLLIAEERGTVRLVDSGRLLPDPALTITDITQNDGRGLLALVVGADVESTGVVFTLHTTRDGLRLSRYVLRGDRLVDGVTLVAGLPVVEAWPSVALCVGPDGRIYIALDDGGDPDEAADLGSYSGKVLRFNTDGTTPDDQAAGSPVYLAGVHRPTGMSWNEEGLWLTEADVDGADRLTRSQRHETDRAIATGRFLLPGGARPSDAAFYFGEAIAAFRGNLLVVSHDAHAILRIRFDEDRIESTEWLLRGLIGPIRSMAVGPDGAIYTVTDTALVRIAGAQ